jgi:TPR repeat protein
VALADLLSEQDSERVRVNLRRAAKLYQRGCEGNIAHACARLAAAYWDEDWKGRDKKRARELEARACDLGDTASCHP